jgi:hypothetical protein
LTLQIVLGLGGGLAALLVLSYFTRPRHLGVRFTKMPPVLARINTPSDDATDTMRRVDLPTGDSYTIPARSRGQFVTVFDWPVVVLMGDARVRLTVPKLCTTDFASIPRPLHSLISPLTNTIYGAILHDYLYRAPADPVAHAISRKDADRIFYWGMRMRGVRRTTAGLMYLGVRLGGRGSYRRSAPAAGVAVSTPH